MSSCQNNSTYPTLWPRNTYNSQSVLLWEMHSQSLSDMEKLRYNCKKTGQENKFLLTLWILQQCHRIECLTISKSCSKWCGFIKKDATVEECLEENWQPLDTTRHEMSRPTMIRWQWINMPPYEPYSLRKTFLKQSILHMKQTRRSWWQYGDTCEDILLRRITKEVQKLLEIL